MELRWTETGSPSWRAASYSTRYISGDSGRISILPSAFGNAALHTAPSDPERQQPFVRQAGPVAVHAREVGDAERLGERRRTRRAIREAAAQSGLLHRPQVLDRVLVGHDVVAPIVHRRDAGVQRFGSGEQRAVIHVARRVDLAERRGHREIAVRAVVAGHVAQQRRPHVPMGIDQAGHDDEAAAVDDLRARRAEPSTDIDNHAVVDMNVTIRKVRLAGLHGHHVGIANDDIAARRQIGDRRRDRCVRSPSETMHGAERCNAAEKCTPTNVDISSHAVLPLMHSPLATRGNSQWVAGRTSNWCEQ